MKATDVARIAHAMARGARHATDVLYLRISIPTQRAQLTDAKGQIVVYNDVIKRTRARLVAMFVIFSDDDGSHALITLQDMRYRKRVMIFDNIGGDTSDVQTVVNYLRRRLSRPDTVFETMSSCPVRRINANGYDCAYWTLAFLKYMMHHPTGSIAGFQQRFSRTMYRDTFARAVAASPVDALQRQMGTLTLAASAGGGHSNARLRRRMETFKPAINRAINRPNLAVTLAPALERWLLEPL